MVANKWHLFVFLYFYILYFCNHPSQMCVCFGWVCLLGCVLAIFCSCFSAGADVIPWACHVNFFQHIFKVPGTFINAKKLSAFFSKGISIFFMLNPKLGKYSYFVNFDLIMKFKYLLTCD